MLRIRSILLLVCLCLAIASAALAAGIPIRGRVLDAAGAPLAKARVRLVPLASVYAAGRPKAEGKDEPAAVASAESGADGGFLLEAPGPGMWVVVVGGGSDGKLAPQEALAAPLTDELDLPAVRLRRETGRPVPSVVWGPPAAVPSPGKPPAGEVAVRVVSASDGRPLPGALVWWTADPGGFRRTDAQGAARLAVPVAEPFAVQAVARGFLIDELEIRKAEEKLQEKPPKPLAFSLEPDLALTGVVVDEAGSPVAGAEIAPTVKNRPHLPVGELMRVIRNRGSLARSGPGGRFRLGGLIAGVDYELRVTKDGFAPSRVQAAAPDGAPGRPAAPLRLVLERGRSAFGKVLDPDRRPVAGAQVTLRTSVPAGPERFRAALRPENQDTFEAVTGADGRFDLRHLPAGRYDLTARGRGWAPLTVPSLGIPEAHRATDLGTLVLAPGVALEGSVVDSAGKPVEGAAIHLREPIDNSFPFPLPGPEEEPAALSGPDGFFRIEDLRAGSTVSLSVLRTGYMAGEAKGVRLPVDQPVRIALQEVGTLSGRVVDSDGEPVADISVRVGFQQRHLFVRGSGSTPMESRSDPEGLFRIQDVPPGPVDLVAQASGWQPGTVAGLELRAGEDKRGIEIVLSPAAVLRGRVLAPSGRAVPDAQVHLAPEDRQSGLHMVSTDDEGRYELDSLPPGLRTLEASHPDHGMARRQVEVRVGDNAFDISLEAGNEVSGRVIDEAGTPVPGAQVWLARAGGLPGPPMSTTSQSDGGFRFAAVVDGSYRTSVSKEGFAPESVPVTVAGGSIEGLELRLGRGGAIVGRIAGIEAAELARVQVVAWGQGTPAGGRMEPDGSYRIDHLREGEWRVRAELPGTGLYAEGAVRLEPGVSEARLDLEMERGYELAGRVRKGGAPVAGETLGLEGPGRRRAVAETDADGRFRFSGLAAGSYHLRLEGSPHEETVDLQGDREIVIDLPVAEVAGRVVDAADGKPLAGVTVQLIAADGTATRQRERTDSRGVFILRGVAEGSWLLRAQADGYASAEAPVRVDDAGPSGEVELSLRATEGVALQVAVAAGALPRSLFYVVLDGAGRKAGDGTAAVGEAGRVRLSRVPQGGWQVLLLSEHTAATEITVTSPGDAGQVTLPPPCTLRVTVPALRDVQMPATLTLTGAGGRPFRALGRMGEPATSWDLTRGIQTLHRVPPGAWQVQVTAADGRTWRATVTTVPGVEAEAVLE